LEYGVRHFNFVDDDFGCIPARTAALMSRLYGRGFEYRCQMRVDSFPVTDTLPWARALYASGCRLASLGIESGDEEVLGRVRKPLNLSWAERVCRSLKDAGIRVRVYIIIGLPYQTVRSVEKTKAFLRRVQPSSVSVELFVPHIGSPIGDDPEQWGVRWLVSSLAERVQRLDWLQDQADVRPKACIETNWMSAEEITRARDEIVAEWQTSAYRAAPH
jgi:radical SAM superfamily enzyme YgiQ (UPF0313 family)